MTSEIGDMGMIKLNGKGFEVEPNWSGKLNGINAGYLAHGTFRNFEYLAVDFQKYLRLLRLAKARLQLWIWFPRVAW